MSDIDLTILEDEFPSPYKLFQGPFFIFRVLIKPWSPPDPDSWLRTIKTDLI